MATFDFYHLATTPYSPFIVIYHVMSFIISPFDAISSSVDMMGVPAPNVARNSQASPSNYDAEMWLSRIVKISNAISAMFYKVSPCGMKHAFAYFEMAGRNDAVRTITRLSSKHIEILRCLGDAIINILEMTYYRFAIS